MENLLLYTLLIKRFNNQNISKSNNIEIKIISCLMG